MRKLFLALMLLGSLNISSVRAEQEDLNLMFERLNEFYAQYHERLENLPAGKQLIAESNDEFNELVTWFGLFLITMTRLKQQAACIIEKEEGLKQVEFIWKIMYPVFTFLDTTIQRAAIEQALLWVDVHGADDWAPEEALEYYIAEEDWALARQDAAAECIALLQTLQLKIDIA